MTQLEQKLSYRFLSGREANDFHAVEQIEQSLQFIALKDINHFCI